MDATDNAKKIIFLDIDGVLQPGWSQKRFDHDLEQTRIDMADKFHDEAYSNLDMYDIGAVLYDWDEDALNNLRILLGYEEVAIVLSTGWKVGRSKEDMFRLFHIHDLDKYIIGLTPDVKEYHKEIEIQAYLDEHPEVTHFVVIDDEDFSKFFPHHTVQTRRAFRSSDLKKAMQILELDL